MLLVKDNTPEGIVDVDLAVVLDEAQFPEFVHEKINPGPRGANHLRQHLLRYFGKHLLRMASRAVVREQQSARQPFLAGVEELVDVVGQPVFLVEHGNQLVFLDDEHGGRCNGGRSRHANGLACDAPFLQKNARSKDRHNGFFARLVSNGELYTAFLNVNHTRSTITLRVDLLRSSIFHNSSGYTGRIEKGLGIQSTFMRGFSFGFNLA